MKFEKYLFLYDHIPTLKSIIEENHLSFRQKLCLKKIYNYYAGKEVNEIRKSELRNKIKKKREEYPIKKLKTKSEKISSILIDSPQYKTLQTVFCYISFDNEIDTNKILNDILANKTLCVPVVKNNRMISAKIENLNNLEKNRYGIFEPRGYAEINKNEIDLVIVPALAFNSLGYRLGYGGGYYDKFLEDYNGISVGLVLKKFLLDNLIPEKHDIPVNDLIIL